MDLNAVIQAISVAQHEFRVEIANTPALRNEAFRLRYQVYCIERGFEPGIGDIETDEYDDRSMHVILRHAVDDKIIGTVRLVAPDSERLNDCFPMQRVCEPSVLRHLPLARTGEISRFAISKERRLSCTSSVLLRLALMRGIMMMSHEMKLTHWCAVMERSLLRLLQVSAIHFHPVGPLVSYHGIRQPSTGSIAGVLGRIKREQYEIWDYVTAGGKYLPPQTIATDAVALQMAAPEASTQEAFAPENFALDNFDPEAVALHMVAPRTTAAMSLAA